MHGIGHQHGVVDRRDADAQLRENLGIKLHVLADLQDAGVFQHRFEQLQCFHHAHLAFGQLVRAEQIIPPVRLVQKRDVASLPRLYAERDAHHVGGHLIEARGLGIDGDIAAFLNAVDPDLQGRLVADAAVALPIKCDFLHLRHLRRIGGGVVDDRHLDAQMVRDPFREGAEFHLREEGHQYFRVGLAHLKIVDGEIEWRVFIEQDQPTREPDLFGMIDQGFAPLGLLDLLRALQQRFQIAEFVDQQGGGLDADPGRTGHIVDTVARQSLHIDHPFRVYAELFEDAFAVDPLVLHRVEHLDPVAHKLHQVLVGGDYGAASACLACLYRQRGDDVVGLKAFLLLAGDVESLGRAAGQGDLRSQLFGHRLAVGLVEVVHVVAEGVAALVEDHRDMGRCLRSGVRLHVAVDHVAKTGDSADRQAVGFAGERRQRVIGAEDESRSVDQVKMMSLAECHGMLLRCPRLNGATPSGSPEQSARCPNANRPGSTPCSA